MSHSVNSALFFANNFLEKGFNENIPITHMKLQKLIYILYKTHLKTTGESLFTESFEAWKYGPVLRSVYAQFSKYGREEITEYFVTYINGVKYCRTINEQVTEAFFNNINEVWELYKNKTGYKLSKYTHIEGGAWDKAVKNDSYVLTDEDIKAEEDYL